MQINNDFSNVETILNNVSETFCLAKWYRTNLRLYNGTSYSCHHCIPRKINLDKVKVDCSALTNTDKILEIRQEMLNGKKPEECKYCWIREEKNLVSDRIIKSKDFIELLNVDVEKTALSLNSWPKILDVAWDNICNLKCSYCGPKNSSKWVEEIERFGPYPTNYRKESLDNIKQSMIRNRDLNPYIEAFWDWWDIGLGENLHQLTITGGEPLLSKNTMKVIDKIIEKDLDLILNINTNLSVPDTIFKSFIKKIINTRIKNLQITTSIESINDKAEYSRYGLNYNKWLESVHEICGIEKIILHITLTNNALSYTDITAVLELIIKLKKLYGKDKIIISSNEVLYPSYLDLRILPRDIIFVVNTNLTKILDENKHLFRENEFLKLTRTIEFSKSEVENKQSLIKDFKIFIKEYDKRRNTSFDATFPELKDFINE